MKQSQKTTHKALLLKSVTTCYNAFYILQRSPCKVHLLQLVAGRPKAQDPKHPKALTGSKHYIFEELFCPRLYVVLVQTFWELHGDEKTKQIKIKTRFILTNALLNLQTQHPEPMTGNSMLETLHETWHLAGDSWTLRKTAAMAARLSTAHLLFEVLGFWVFHETNAFGIFHSFYLLSTSTLLLSSYRTKNMYTSILIYQILWVY